MRSIPPSEIDFAEIEEDSEDIIDPYLLFEEAAIRHLDLSGYVGDDSTSEPKSSFQPSYVELSKGFDASLFSLCVSFENFYNFV